MIELIDTHSHLDAPEFDPDRAEAVARAQQAGVLQQVLPAVSAASWDKLRQTTASHAGLHPAYGLHPMYLAEHQPQHLQLLDDWLRREPALAVGEAGLDFFVPELDRPLQQFYFEAQLDLARQHDLPVILHARRAVDAVIAGIRRCRPRRGVIHSFAGSIEQARQLQTLGFKLGFGGPVTYLRARRLRELVSTLPLQQLLIETDAPDQPLHGHQGLRNEPALLPQVLHTMAQLRGMPSDTLAHALNANAIELFGARLSSTMSAVTGQR